jgi:hypothetical protein
MLQRDVSQRAHGLADAARIVDRAETLKFVRSEHGNQANAIIMVRGILELDLSSKHATAPQPRLSDSASPHLRAA